jgi:menaquinone-dependent protoporphyrinogen oxidase
MKPVLVLYATREGYTRRIAEHVAATARGRGFAVDVTDVASIPSGIWLGSYAAVIIAASVHLGRHEREMTQFVKRHVSEISLIPSVFLSISLSEAAAEDAAATPENRARAGADAKKMIAVFLSETGWRPTHIQAVAGALLFTRYNRVLRFVMAGIARKAGMNPDITRDYEFTDWAELDRLIDQMELPEAAVR